MHDKDPFAARDAFGLTTDDWMSFLGFPPETYSGPALLWWALVGAGAQEDWGDEMSDNPFLDLLASLAGDARALATLASSSSDDNVRALSKALGNLQRRLEAAAEIALRMEEDDNDPAPDDPPLRPALPTATSKPRR